MAPAGTLWTTPAQWKGKAIKAIAAFGGVEVAEPASYEHFVDNKKPEFLAKFPHGKIPAWEGAEGFKLFEGAAIARYVASLAPNSGLLGNSTEDAALVDQWVHLVESEVDVYTDFVRTITSGQIPYNKPTHTNLLERQTRALNTLDAHLKANTFFVGERITAADIWVATLIQKAVGFTVDAPARAKLPNLVRHLETIANQPKLKEIFGEINYVEKGIQFTPPAKEAKPKAAPAPKAAPKKAEAEEEEEPAAPVIPKSKHPLEDLPKSSFNLEDWKRAYSNLDTRGPGGAIEWFYQHNDPVGISVWRVDFKWQEELTHTFMSSNQVTGFFNRLEASRKYAFGSVGVLGEDNNNMITGVLIVRGQEIVPVVDVAPDWESYSFTKLDLSNDADKAYFEGALAWDLEIDGKKWVDGKNLK
ncbi:elongation factor 1-gamma [Coprinopsis cinerea okayama7|uniref:Elongation factor 1-gamma n=1 Tax=Coprinopsis cinerea (strain Okayama-7 / 130 / ATCC MYA-4618 / FGSC 9003) TaxID=240176 RepID=A8NI75_COPC7|nr:elongation factor 1-gamma [Coprinopsis cinerea okayama7\|eukprot:XP_001833927.1 elongation factor 1-gamma [Coprinopsis cinerea okayama7\